MKPTRKRDGSCWKGGSIRFVDVCCFVWALFISSVSTLIMAFVEALHDGLLLLKPPRSWPGAKPSPEAAVRCVAIFHNDGTGVNGFFGLDDI